MPSVNTVQTRPTPRPTQSKSDGLDQVRQGKVLKKGSRGLEVAAAQKALNQAGANLKIDGRFGPKTDAAVRAYQQKNGLKVDGALGRNTMGVLDGKASATRESQPQRRGADAATQRGSRQAARRADQQSRQEKVGGDAASTSRAANVDAAGASKTGDFKGINQSDPRWKSHRLGNSRSNTLGRAGCMLAAFGMAGQAKALGGKTQGKGLDQLNSLVKRKGGFSGAALNSGAAARAMGMKLESRTTVRSGAQAAAALRRQLDQGKPMVAGVDYKAGSRGSSRGTGVDHWITITGRDKANPNKFTALDPAGGKAITLTLGNDGVLRGGPKNYKVRELIQLGRS